MLRSWTLFGRGKALQGSLKVGGGGRDRGGDVGKIGEHLRMTRENHVPCPPVGASHLHFAGRGEERVPCNSRCLIKGKRHFPGPKSLADAARLRLQQQGE